MKPGRWTAGEVYSIDFYQQSAMRFHVPDPVRLAAYGLGIAGEAGECADLIKKHIGHGHPLDVVKLKLELGDVLWYVAGLAELAGLTLSEVASANLAKLEKRYPSGFNTADSIARRDVK
jgi:NTP pyrophosphatase (non-canonical NTP hydrolase)